MKSSTWRLAASVGPCWMTRSALCPFGPPGTTDSSYEFVPWLNSQYFGQRPPSVTACGLKPLSVSQLL